MHPSHTSYLRAEVFPPDPSRLGCSWLSCRTSGKFLRFSEVRKLFPLNRRGGPRRAARRVCPADHRDVGDDRGELSTRLCGRSSICSRPACDRGSQRCSRSGGISHWGAYVMWYDRGDFRTILPSHLPSIWPARVRWSTIFLRG